jgi:alpha-tubulin suppressor-like RCC1 family protein
MHSGFVRGLVVGLIGLVALPAAAQTLTGGAGHSVVVKSDGTVWTFGLNNQGQLGDNTLTTRSTPIQVTALSGVTVVAVAAGAYHTLALTSTGTLYVWGDNAYGQVGDASTTDRKLPVQSSLANVVAIAAGEYHSVALTSSGAAYTWGRNTNGQLSTGNTTNATSPTQVLTGVSAIGAGFDHTLFVKTDGTVRASGLNSSGQLGDGTTTQRTTAVSMSGVTGAVAAAGGDRHSVILLSAGTLKATGYNASGQVGDASSTQRTTPVAVSTLTTVVALAVGADHALARKADNTVWAWGANSTGALGDGTTTARTSPVPVTTLSGITKIGTGHDHSLAVTSTGIVSTWGANGNSQLGDGTTVARSSPLAISDAGYDWRVATPTLSVASGTYTTDRTVTVSVATTGATIRYTRTGVDPTESDATVTSGSTLSVTYSQTLKVKAWKAGMPASHVTAATYTMQVAQPTLSPSGGTYTSAQTVTMTTATPGATLRYTTDGSTPTPASTPYTGAISVGTSTTVKVVGFKTNWSDSTLRTGTFTMNFGTLTAPTVDPATGSYVNSATVTMSALAGAAIRYTTNNTAVQSTSPLYTEPLAVDVTTTIRARAYHPDYTSSAETTRTYTLAAGTPVFSPTAGTYPAGQLITVTAPSVGSTIHYTLNGLDPTTSDPVIASGATLVAGHYTLKARAWKTGADPSAVASATYAITGTVATGRVVAGGDHTLAVRPDGLVWAWGMNSSGQAGQGTTVSPQVLPRMVAGLTGITTIGAGDAHGLARRTSGAVAAWGLNGSGRLGDGSTTTRLLPVDVSGVTDAVAVAAGDDHTLALRADGTVLAFGHNAAGELGDGSTTTRLTPVAVSGLTSITALSAGRDFSLARKQDGTVWAWGENSSFQLADGTTTDRSTPAAIAGITTATAVAAGTLHGLALLADGTVVGWGRNVAGALGDGTTTNRSAPVAVVGLTNIVAIAAGMDFSLALDSSGTVWSWGTNGTGQLADGGTTGRTSPAAIGGLADIVQITAGGQHALALTADGTVYAWGRNLYGAVGDGTTTDRLTPVAISGPTMAWRVATPQLSLGSGQYNTEQTVTVTVADPDATLRYTTTGVDPTASDATVASGGTLNITSSQTLKVSGWKSGAPTSVVATGVYELKVVAPTMTPGTAAYTTPPSVAIATSTASATSRYTLDGTEPSPASAQYGSPVTVAQSVTVRARSYRSGWTPSDVAVASYLVSEGQLATPTLAPAGGTFTDPVIVTLSGPAGATLRYTLDGSTPAVSSAIYREPLLVSATTVVTARAFKSGWTASTATATTYAVDATGAAPTPVLSPSSGQYTTQQLVTVTGAAGTTLRYTTSGLDPTETDPAVTSGSTILVDRTTVLKVRAWQAGVTPSRVRASAYLITGAVAAGRDHSLALTADRKVYSWGYNYYGQTGDGGSANRLSPVHVLSNVVAIAAGDYHSLALLADGTVMAWGQNGSGALGDGTTTLRRTPTAVSGLTNVVAIAAGGGHSLAVKADGSVWAWGRNQDGEIGDGSTTARTTPVQVLGLVGATHVVAGQDFSLALVRDAAAGGSVWAWGANAMGTLGDGSTVGRSVPVRVASMPTATTIAAGTDWAAAVGTDGRLRSWGHNHRGQLADGGSSDRLTPSPSISVPRLLAVAAAQTHGLVVDVTGTPWGWGDGTYGQLGSGSGTCVSDACRVPGRLRGAGPTLGAAGGKWHSLLLGADGRVRSMGLNTSGQLGLGDTTTRAVPTTLATLQLVLNDASLADPDGDGLPTWREIVLGSDPVDADTNDDGVGDGEAALTDTTTHPDPDGDGVPTAVELARATNPFQADTDGDGVNDRLDAYPLDPTRWDGLSPTPGDTTPPVITITAPSSVQPHPPE